MKVLKIIAIGIKFAIVIAVFSPIDPSYAQTVTTSVDFNAYKNAFPPTLEPYVPEILSIYDEYTYSPNTVSAYSVTSQFQAQGIFPGNYEINAVCGIFGNNYFPGLSSASFGVNCEVTFEPSVFGNVTNAVVQVYVNGGETVQVFAGPQTQWITASQAVTFNSSSVPLNRIGIFSNDSVMTSITVQSVPIPNLDLAAGTPTASAPATMGLYGSYQVSPNSAFVVEVPVSGINFNSPETRSTTVTLEAGPEPIQSQIISLADIQAAGGTLNVPFTVTFPTADIGLQNITARVDPENLLNESNFTNNFSGVQLNVVNPYTIVATVNGTQVSSSQAAFSLPPTTLTDPGCSAKLLPYKPSILPLTLTCQDGSGNAISGCSFALALTPGDFNGGHSHGGDRPLACLSSGPYGCPSIANILTQGQTGSIAQDGTLLNYAAPEVSGDVVLTVAGNDPNGNAISSSNLPNPITFHVQANGSVNSDQSGAWVPLSNDNVFVIINGADPTPSHPTGFYGTQDMADAVDVLGSTFVELLSAVEDAPTIGSQAASLPWGGIYDVERDWDTPHCGHRDGKTIDLSLSNLDANEKAKLQRAAAIAKLAFYYAPESPDNKSANHWHATLKQ